METLTERFKVMEKLRNVIEVTELCQQRDLPARLVGRWIWIEFADKPSADVRAELKAAGFHWSPKRLAWQHNCGHPTRAARGYDPRDKYGSVELERVSA